MVGSVSGVRERGSGSGTHHCAILEREVVRELVAEVGGNGVVACEGTVVRGRCGEDHIRAELEGGGACVRLIVHAMVEYELPHSGRVCSRRRHGRLRPAPLRHGRPP